MCRLALGELVVAVAGGLLADLPQAFPQAVPHGAELQLDPEAIPAEVPESTAALLDKAFHLYADHLLAQSSMSWAVVVDPAVAQLRESRAVDAASVTQASFERFARCHIILLGKQLDGERLLGLVAMVRRRHKNIRLAPQPVRSLAALLACSCALCMPSALRQLEALRTQHSVPPTQQPPAHRAEQGNAAETSIGQGEDMTNPAEQQAAQKAQAFLALKHLFALYKAGPRLQNDLAPTGRSGLEDTAEREERSADHSALLVGYMLLRVKRL